MNKYNAEYLKCENCGFMQIKNPYWLDMVYKNPIAPSDTGLCSRKNNQLEDTVQEWERFARKNIIFWKNFVRKWILSTKNEKNTIYLSYEELTEQPQKSLKKVIKFIRPKEQINPKLIEEVINKQKIKEPRDIKSFKYFNPKFFKEIEQKVSRELKELGLKNKK